MNKLSPTEHIARTIRTGLAVAAMAGVGMAGSGIAGASTVGPTGPIVRVPLVTCAAPVSLSTTYGYSYQTSTDEVLSLSGSGCSQTASPVKVSVAAKGQTWSTMVTPKLVPGTLEYKFSFTDSNYTTLVADGAYYLTYNAALASEIGRGPSQATVTYSASQAASRGSSSVSFTLYWDNPDIP
jgi:hypothetical protein